jgi:hypothetical protein
MRTWLFISFVGLFFNINNLLCNASSSPAGKYSLTPGAVASTICSSCSTGKYQTNVGSITCVGCLAGKYVASSGSNLESACLLCAIGQYSTNMGMAGCSECLAGQHAFEKGSSSCSQCEVGKFVTSTGASSCVSCPAGFYEPDRGSSRGCTGCAAGRYLSVIGGSLSAECMGCAAGRYLSATGGSLFFINALCFPRMLQSWFRLLSLMLQNLAEIKNFQLSDCSKSPPVGILILEPLHVPSALLAISVRRCQAQFVRAVQRDRSSPLLGRLFVRAALRELVWQ